MIRLVLLTFFLMELADSGRINAQAKNDYIWILGNHPNDQKNGFGGVMLNFNHDIASPMYFKIYCDALEPAVLSTNHGKLLAYTDGCRLYNAENEIMNGGDSISYGEIWNSHCDYGYPGTQNNLLLSWPGDSSRAILFHMKTLDDFSATYLLYSTLKFNPENPLGIVTNKNKYLLNPKTSALVTATRHANGRDWWVIFPEGQTNRFFSILVFPKGVSIVDTQSIGIAWGPREWGGQAVFTPDGKKYIRFNPWKGLDIFEFDRCTGQLSNIIESGPFSDPVIEAGGVSVSPDSKYLYVSNGFYLYQFDLLAEDIISSKILIATYDGYRDPLPANFYQMSLAPDGKIYMFSTNDVKSISVINHPERKGLSCEFNQNAMKLPAFIILGSINFPYFRLGPEDGSSCDTLGINNLSIADFRYEIDSLNPMLVHFNNLSYFEPITFNWTFGNNTTSTLKHPVPVEYASYGIYDVCLTVANEYGNNTFCRTINLNDSITSVDDVYQHGLCKIHPNPFTSELDVTMEENLPDMDFILYSAFGVVVYEYRLRKKETRISLPELTNGLYFYCIRQKGNIVQTGKLVKTE